MPTHTDAAAMARGAMQATAGIGCSFLSVRLRGAADAATGFGLAWSDALSLSLLEEALATSRHEAGDGRVVHGHAVTCDAAEAVARLTAVAEAPRQGVATIEARLSLTLAVTNHGPEQLIPHLWLAWSGMMPGHSIVPAGLAGNVAVAALVQDRDSGFARFLSTISGPVAGDRKIGSTAPGGAGEPGIYTAALPPHGLACGGCAPDISEGPLVLAALAPGGSVALTWQLAIEAEARAGASEPPAEAPLLLSRRGLALTGRPRAS